MLRPDKNANADRSKLPQQCMALVIKSIGIKKIHWKK
jgi:hypothetical protein